MPKGTLARVVRCTFKKLTNSPCAVSGRKYILFWLSSVTPREVSNIRLKVRIGVQSNPPQLGQCTLCSRIYASISSLDITSGLTAPLECASMRLSARWRVLHCLQSILGSEKDVVCPLASHTREFIRIAASTPKELSLSCTKRFHQARLILFLISTPTGP